MPNYYNPYNFYPVGYANQMGYSGIPQPQPVMQQSQSEQPRLKPMEWVEGEVGAKAFQMPPGLMVNQPIPLWDSTDTVVWLKSWGPMGIPNPMQKLVYEMPEQQQSQALLMNGQSGAQDLKQLPDMSNFATKEDINSLREEVRMMRQHNQSQSKTGYSGNAQQNQNGSSAGNQSIQNRGGNQ